MKYATLECTADNCTNNANVYYGDGDKYHEGSYVIACSKHAKALKDAGWDMANKITLREMNIQRITKLTDEIAYDEKRVVDIKKDIKEARGEIEEINRWLEETDEN